MESPLGSDLARLVRIWRALIDHRLKPLELTQTHWVTLHNIHQLPPDQSQIQLAKAIGIEQPSLVRTLDQLEIRKDDGNTIMVVQKQGNTRFSPGQRVVLASNGSQVTVSPR